MEMGAGIGSLFWDFRHNVVGPGLFSAVSASTTARWRLRLVLTTFHIPQDIFLT